MSTTVSPAPTPASEAKRLEGHALVLCAHGTRGVVGAAAAHAAALRAHGRFDQARACCLYGRPGLEATLHELEGHRVTVLPFMMAEGWTLDALRRRLAQLRPDARLCPPVGAHDGMVELILARALRGCEAEGWPPSATALLLVGHGTARHPASGATARRHAQAITARGVFAEVATAFLDESPTVAEAVADLAAPHVAAIGFLTDAGSHGLIDVPRLLRATGRSAVYLGPIGPDPALVPLILEQARG